MAKITLTTEAEGKRTIMTGTGMVETRITGLREHLTELEVTFNKPYQVKVEMTIPEGPGEVFWAAPRKAGTPRRWVTLADGNVMGTVSGDIWGRDEFDKRFKRVEVPTCLDD